MWKSSDHCYMTAENTGLSHLCGMCYNSSMFQLVLYGCILLVAVVEGIQDLELNVL